MKYGIKVGIILWATGLNLNSAVAQLKHYNIWPIGTYKYLLDFRSGQAELIEDPLFGDSFYIGQKPIHYRNTYCNKLGQRINTYFKPYFFDSLGNRMNVPYVPDSLIWDNLFLPTGASTNYQWLATYNNYAYTRDYPLLISYCNDFLEDNMASSIRSYKIDLKYKVDGAIRSTLIPPNCSNTLYFAWNSDNSILNGPYYMDLLRIDSGKISYKKNLAQASTINVIVAIAGNGKCIVNRQGSPRAVTFHSFDCNTLEYGTTPFYRIKEFDNGIFATDGYHFYYINQDSLIQLDLRVQHSDSIQKSKKLINLLPQNRMPGEKNRLVDMELAPDGKIYISFLGIPYLSTIERPNESGINCQFNFDVFPLSPDTLNQFDYVPFPIIPYGALYHPSLNTEFEDTVCLGQYFTLKTNHCENFIQHTWKCSKLNSNYLFQSNACSTQLKLDSPGTYFIDLFYSWGCDFKDSIRDTIIVYQQLVPPRIRDTVLCENLILTLNPSFDASKIEVYWSNGELNFPWTTASSGNYSVHYSGHCLDIWDTFRVEIPGPLIKPVEDYYVLCLRDSELRINARIEENVTLVWFDSSKLPYTLIKKPGIYKITTENKCISDTWWFTVRPEDPQNVLYVPNVFTPDQNNLNDKFEIVGTEELSEFSMVIFNLWGQKVFETRDPKFFWSGAYKGGLVQEGVYVYSIECRSRCSGDLTYRGVIHVLYRE